MGVKGQSIVNLPYYFSEELLLWERELCFVVNNCWLLGFISPAHLCSIESKCGARGGETVGPSHSGMCRRSHAPQTPAGRKSVLVSPMQKPEQHANILGCSASAMQDAVGGPKVWSHYPLLHMYILWVNMDNVDQT